MGDRTPTEGLTPRSGTFLPLLVALLSVLVLIPFTHDRPLISSLLVSTVLATGVLAMHRSPLHRGAMTIAVLLLLAFRWWAHVYADEHSRLLVAAHLAIGGYLCLLTAMCVAVVLRRPRVTHDAVLGALCGYLLIAFMFAFFCAALEDALPGSFLSSVALPEYEGARIGSGTPQLLYYSFVVLTSVGFGDIIPANPYARSLAMLEMLSGQFYLAAFVARLVGLMGSQKAEDGGSASERNNQPGEDA